MDIFFLQLIILFIPGIIWERIDSRFGINRPSSQFDILRRSFCFGIASYVIADIFIYFFDAALFALSLALQIDSRKLPFAYVSMHQFQKDKFDLQAYDIVWIVYVSAVAILLSVAWLYISNRKVGVRFMQKIGATKRFGDEDVWDFTFNSREATVEYVHVRDLENELNWSGWVELFSETGRSRELVLRDVEVSNIEGTVLYSTPRVYLARSTDAMTIEFPYRGSSQPSEGVADEAEVGG